MADPYVPFGFMPAMLDRNRGPAPQPPLMIPPLMPQTAEGGLMPQSEQEAADMNPGLFGSAYMASPMLGLPFALGPVGSFLGRGAAGLATRFPRASTLGAGGTMLTGQSTAAGPQKQQKPAPSAPRPAPAPAVDPQTQLLLESDPVLRRLQTQIDEQDAIANAPAAAYPKSARDGARMRAADLTKEFNARLGELSRANLPFDQAYPWLAQNRGLVGFLAPAGVGYAARAAGNLVSRAMSSPWERAMRSADRALERGNEKAYEHFMRRATQFEPGQPGRLGRAAHALTPPAAGGFAGLELSMLPYHHNLTNAPLGSPQREDAERMLSDPMRWGPRAAFGFGVGALGGATGGHLPNIPPGFRPPRPGLTGPAPLPPTAGPTTAAPLPPAVRTPTASPPPPGPPPAPAPLPPTPGTGAMWPAPPSPVPGPPPGLASIRTPRPSGPSPTDSPPMPQSAVGAPARPMPEGAYQDASGRWRVGRRWIKDPSK